MEQIQHEIKEKNAIRGRYRFTIRNAKTGKVKRTYAYENLVPLAARALIAFNFTDGTGSPMLINKFVVGSSTTPPAASDTQLGTETYRNDIASRTSGSNVFYCTGFIDATENSGTYREAGLVAGGTGAANTGTLISHVAINIVKTSLETLTIDFEGEIL